jgi:hypothetical protein
VFRCRNCDRAPRGGPCAGPGARRAGARFRSVPPVARSIAPVHRRAHCDAPPWLRPEPWFPAPSRQPCCSQARYVQAGSAQADFPLGLALPGPPLPWAPCPGRPCSGRLPARAGSALGGSARAGSARAGCARPVTSRRGSRAQAGPPLSPVMAPRSEFRKSSYILIMSRRWRCGSLPGRSLADRWRGRPAASAVTRTRRDRLPIVRYEPHSSRDVTGTRARPPRGLGRRSGPAGPAERRMNKGLARAPTRQRR